jgi:hypothetical protein
MSKIPPGPETVHLNGIIVGEVVSTGDPEEDKKPVRQRLKDNTLARARRAPVLFSRVE